MRTSIKCFLSIAVLVCGAITQAAEQMDEKRIKELTSFGTKAFGIKWDAQPIGGTERGVSAVTDGNITLTTRDSSRTFILHDRKHFPPREEDQFKGSDAALKRIGIRLLLASGANKSEILQMKISRQFTQLGQANQDGKAVKLQAAKRSHPTLVITRQVGGVPVLSSRLLLNVDSAGRIAFMELSWPDIDPEVIARANRYRAVVAKKFVAPEMEGAAIEEVQSSVLHSPAVGFYNDMAAGIRVIYSPTAKQIGQKSVRYLDETGNDISMPRDVDLPKEEVLKRDMNKQ